LDSMEQAIRNALGKGNAEDPAFRERVYRSAQAALERAVLANQAIPAEAIARRRKQFLDTIARIEADFAPAVAPAAPVARPAPRMPSIDIDERRAPPQRPVQPAGRMEPSFGDERGEPAAPAAPERRERQTSQPVTQERAPLPQRRRKPFPWGMLAGLTIFVVIVGLVYWAAVEFGLVGSSNGRGQSPLTAPQNNSGSSEAPARPGNNDPLADWMPVFSPSDPTSVAVSPGARAEVVTRDGHQVMRISSGRGGAPLRFEIGAGVLERLAGKRALFDIVAVASGEATQMSVTCALGGLEDCGRNRYPVGVEQSEYLFEVEVPQGAGRAAGAIEIIADVSDGDKSVDIVEIRVSTAAVP